MTMKVNGEGDSMKGPIKDQLQQILDEMNAGKWEE